ncbi:MAG: hypothetical protein ACYCOU_00665 [Sulfobacillus sp.]
MNDVGEALRGIVPNGLVWSSYAVVAAYAGADVVQAAIKARRLNKDPAAAAADAGIFHLFATIAVTPAIVAAACKVTKIAVSRSQKDFIRRFSPSVVGIAIIPLIVPKVDRLVERMMDKHWRKTKTE